MLAALLRNPPLSSAPARCNAAIRRRLESGHPTEAVSAFAAMLQTGARPDAFTLPLLNRAAASLPGFVGTAHCFGIRAGFGRNVYFCNTLLEAYIRHGLVAPACQVFDEMRARDVVSWTTLVSAYAGAWDLLEVSQMVTAMRTNGDCEPSAVTLSVVLRACTDMRDAIGGRQLHCYAVKSGWAGDFLVLNSMLTHLSRTASLEDAAMLFEQSPRRDMISCNIIISRVFFRGEHF